MELKGVIEMPLPEIVTQFSEGPGKPTNMLVSEKRHFEFDDNPEKAFIDYAKYRYEGASFINKLDSEKVKEYYCRYDGINGYYTLTEKDCQGSFPVYYIDL